MTTYAKKISTLLNYGEAEVSTSDATNNDDLYNVHRRTHSLS